MTAVVAGRARALIGAALLAGCTVGPDYQDPTIEVPSRFASGGGADSATLAPIAWWQSFRDPVLNRLIRQGLEPDSAYVAAALRESQHEVSVLDALASLVNLFAVRHALSPADEEHRFGHGKAEALAGLERVAAQQRPQVRAQHRRVVQLDGALDVTLPVFLGLLNHSGDEVEVEGFELFSERHG